MCLHQPLEGPLDSTICRLALEFVLPLDLPVQPRLLIGEDHVSKGITDLAEGSTRNRQIPTICMYAASHPPGLLS